MARTILARHLTWTVEREGDRYYLVNSASESEVTKETARQLYLLLRQARKRIDI